MAPECNLQKWRAAQEPVPWRDVPGRQAGGPFSEYDALGRKQPRRLGIPDYLLFVAGIEPGRVRHVPAASITEEGEDDDGPFAFVACPCAAHPVVHSRLERCAGCERYYVLVERGAVFVAYGSMTPPPVS